MSHEGTYTGHPQIQMPCVHDFVVGETLKPLPPILPSSMFNAKDFPVQYEPQKAAIPILPETERRAFKPSSQSSYFVKFLLALTN